MRVKDGVVLAVEKIVQSKLLTPGANRRIASGDFHVGVAFCGLLADGNQLLQRVREEAVTYRDSYRTPITGKVRPVRRSKRVCV